MQDEPSEVLPQGWNHAGSIGRGGWDDAICPEN